MNRTVIEETYKRVDANLKEEAESLARRVLNFYFDSAGDAIEVLVPNGKLFIGKDEFPVFFEEFKSQLDNEVGRML